MLRTATLDAKRKAEVLCSAAGKTLGELLSIDYHWGDIKLQSNTVYDMAEECIAMPMRAKGAAINLNPQDCRASDSATFVWEIQ